MVKKKTRRKSKCLYMAAVLSDKNTGSRTQSYFPREKTIDFLLRVELSDEWVLKSSPGRSLSSLRRWVPPWLQHCNLPWNSEFRFVQRLCDLWSDFAIFSVAFRCTRSRVTCFQDLYSYDHWQHQAGVELHTVWQVAKKWQYLAGNHPNFLHYPLTIWQLSTNTFSVTSG